MATSENELPVGQSRIGLMIDGLPETPKVAAMLERTTDRVELTIPFLDGHEDIYQYWFSGGIVYADDPARTKRRYEPPNSVSFYGSTGSVGLVGSHVIGSTRKFGGVGIGEGRLTFDYSILGARSSTYYELLNGLRSEIEGLGTWVGLRSLSPDRKTEDNRLIGVNLKLESSPSIRVGRRLNAELQSNWRYGPGPGPDQTTITERMQICTEVKKAASWEDHLRVHFDLRNLLRVASWIPLNFVTHEAMSRADPLRTMDGKAHGNKWLPVVTHRTSITESVTKLKWTDFLFLYDTVGSRGIGRWFKLSKKFERGLRHLIGLLELEGASIEAHLAQAAIGIEMLGYDLLIESGKISKGKTHVPFAVQADAVSSAVADVLPFSADDFPALLRRTYLGVKHPDNEQPEVQEAHLAYAQAIQVLRAWVAVRLGMPKKKLASALENDKLTRRIHRLSPEA